MPNYTTNKFDVSTALIDNNQKVDVEALIAKLQLWQDLFGSALDSHWTVGTILGITEGGTLVEAAGKLSFQSTSAGAARMKGVLSPAVFDDLIVEIDVENFAVGGVGAQWDARQLLHVYKDATNYAEISRQNGHGSDKIYWRVVVGGVSQDLQSVNTNVANYKLKIQRSGNNWTAWYDIGAGWVQISTAAANNRDIGSDTQVTVMGFAGVGTAGKTTDFDCMEVLITGSGYYWDDDPEIYVINDTGDEWAFDAGFRRQWKLFAASCVITEPGTSTLKFKVGTSNTGLFVDAVWRDAAWQTIAQVTASAATGKYDGSRYIHIKVQFASGGADQPTLTSFTITATAVMIKTSAGGANCDSAYPRRYPGVSSSDIVLDMLFDEGAGQQVMDATQHGNHGAMVNMEEADWVSGPFGRGFALDFDGANEFVRLGTNIMPDLGAGGEAFYMSIWFKVPPGIVAGILFNYTGWNPGGAIPGWYTFIGAPPNNDAAFCTMDGAGVTTLSSNIAVRDNQWHHLVCLRDVNKPLNGRIYIDGVDRTGAGSCRPGGTNDTTHWKKIGEDHWGGAQLLGQVANLLISKGTVSASEALRLCNQPRARYSSGLESMSMMAA